MAEHPRRYANLELGPQGREYDAVADRIAADAPDAFSTGDAVTGR